MFAGPTQICIGSILLAAATFLACRRAMTTSHVAESHAERHHQPTSSGRQTRSTLAGGSAQHDGPVAGRPVRATRFSNHRGTAEGVTRSDGCVQAPVSIWTTLHDAMQSIMHTVQRRR